MSDDAALDLREEIVSWVDSEDKPTIPLDAETENSGQATEIQPTIPLDA